MPILPKRRWDKKTAGNSKDSQGQGKKNTQADDLLGDPWKFQFKYLCLRASSLKITILDA